MNKNNILFYDLVPLTYRAEFIKKVIQVSQKLSINLDSLMLTMRIETAGTFTVSIQNGCGLIQFIPATAKGLGTIIEGFSNYDRSGTARLGIKISVTLQNKDEIV